MVYELRQDDPKKCTSAKLRKFNLAKKIPSIRSIPESSVVLNPASHITLSREDRDNIEHHGLVGLDCSWNLSEQLFSRRIPGENRKLPTLLAGNPTNYATPQKLSTAEALAAALYITGFYPEAKQILALFKWGNTFLSLNQEPLDAYAESPANRLQETQSNYFGPQEG